MPAILGRHTSYPPSGGWDMVKLRRLAFKPFEAMDDEEKEYLQMWLATEPQQRVMYQLSAWEREDSETQERRLDELAREHEKPVGRAMFYKPGQQSSIDPKLLARGSEHPT